MRQFIRVTTTYLGVIASAQHQSISVWAVVRTGGRLRRPARYGRLSGCPYVSNTYHSILIDHMDIVRSPEMKSRLGYSLASFRHHHSMMPAEIVDFFSLRLFIAVADGDPRQDLRFHNALLVYTSSFKLFLWLQGAVRFVSWLKLAKASLWSRLRKQDFIIVTRRRERIYCLAALTNEHRTIPPQSSTSPHTVPSPALSVNQLLR